MNSFESLGLKHDGRTLWVLDQTQLPDAETWLDGSQPEAMIALIQRLAVRGHARKMAAKMLAQGHAPLLAAGALGDLRVPRP